MRIIITIFNLYNTTRAYVSTRTRAASIITRFFINRENHVYTHELRCAMMGGANFYRANHFIPPCVMSLISSRKKHIDISIKFFIFLAMTEFVFDATLDLEISCSIDWASRDLKGNSDHLTHFLRHWKKKIEKNFEKTFLIRPMLDWLHGNFCTTLKTS